MSLLELFCAVDDFCRRLEPAWQQPQRGRGPRQRQRARPLCLCEIMTSLIAFHSSGYRNFKTSYQEHVGRYWRAEFPGAVSYNRFVEFMPSALLPRCAYLHPCLGACTGIAFLDSTPLAVCDNHRSAPPKVFDGVARRGKSSTGWFLGFNMNFILFFDIILSIIDAVNYSQKRRTESAVVLHTDPHLDRGARVTSV